MGCPALDLTARVPSPPPLSPRLSSFFVKVPYVLVRGLTHPHQASAGDFLLQPPCGGDMRHLTSSSDSHFVTLPNLTFLHSLCNSSIPLYWRKSLYFVYFIIEH